MTDTTLQDYPHSFLIENFKYDPIALAFTEEGWLQGSNVFHRPTKRFWKGMHTYIKSQYDNKLQGTITHYDALPDAQSTIRAMTRSADGASTHFLIDRDGSIYQLVSIRDRAWHAGLKSSEWPENNGKFLMPNGHLASNPNHWFVGVDFANRGLIDSKTKEWEPYTYSAVKSYLKLMAQIVFELGIARNMHLKHSDTSPTRKIDPGPLLPHTQCIKSVYRALDATMNMCLPDDDRIGDINEA